MALLEVPENTCTPTVPREKIPDALLVHDGLLELFLRVLKRKLDVEGIEELAVHHQFSDQVF